MGTFKARNVPQFVPLLPHKGDLQERRAPEALHTLADVLPAVRRSLALSQEGCGSLVVTPMGPQHPGWATSRAPGHQTFVIPDLFDCFSVRSNAPALLETKKPIALCCPQLEA